ncbi:hypothetical protein WG66_000765 [Moniliophthora roreri]|nr:hypothetical protein WG66_000765 [Moniliophthora roreri]
MHMSQRIKEIVVETVLLGLFNPSFARFFLRIKEIVVETVLLGLFNPSFAQFFLIREWVSAVVTSLALIWATAWA